MQIKTLRENRGMTQEQLAKKMNVHQSSVSLWEAGKTKPLRKYRAKLAKTLGCTVDELLIDAEGDNK